ncbi:hypothetical protein [Burkholderia cenocepacia]|uniref:hypothetical protein n=1 Tax=Burkholderia cenocepacia TaxID=95486 RepID=UPI002AB77C6B|nr:hypothetical protein [Burkholderia cenocepacia]
MKSHLSVKPLLAFAILVFQAAHSFAAIDLIPKEVKVEGGAVSVRVINNGDRPAYVSVSLSRLLNPGVSVNEERLEPVADAVRPALYASPFRMSLAPGQTKLVTLRPVRPVETETVYRLDVKPVVKVLSAEQKKALGNIVVNLGFRGLVRQLPSKAREGLAVACESSGARLTATGNVRYQVEGAKADGRVLDGFNVYPGVPIPVAGHVIEIPGHQACRMQ